jgi:hypothetical protein
MVATGSRPRWSVALSGGGHRASLYGAGALLCLVDVGINREVGSVVSVSGGSLTNGVLAQAQVPFSEMDRRSFLDAIGPLLDRSAYKGTVQWAREVIAWVAAVFVAIVVTVALLLGSVFSSFRRFLGVGQDHPWLYGAAAVAVVVLCLAPLLAVRSWVADRVFRRLLFSRAGRPVKLQASADGCPESPVRHIFCASELQSNLHAYFSPRFIYNFDFGVSTQFDLPLSTAVQASSNFPPAFPARRLRVNRLGLTAHEGADALWLTDGGVYDNMAEEWVTGAFDRDPDQQKMRAELAGDPPERLLVVNASKRDDFKKTAGWLRLPVLGEPGVLLRLTGLMHQVTTTNRRTRLIDEFTARRRLSELKVPPSLLATRLEQVIGIPGTLSHIGTPADWIPQKYPSLTSGAFGTINTAFAALNDEAKEWVTHSHRAACALGTKLSKTGEDTAAALLWQGYVLTTVYLCLDDDTLPFALPTHDDIVEILRQARATTG